MSAISPPKKFPKILFLSLSLLFDVSFGRLKLAKRRRGRRGRRERRRRRRRRRRRVRM